MTDTIPPDLRSLFAPIGVERFFADYWQRKTLFLQLGAAELALMLKEAGPLEIARLAGLARGGVQAWIANEQLTHSVLPVDATSAEKALSIGATLYFIDVPLPRLQNAMAVFLGTAPQKIVASFFLTPAGGGAAWHFDANENFTIQLTGAKCWGVADTPTVPAAPDGYVVGLHVPASLKDLMADVKPEPDRKIDLVAGSLLYVPRGVLHRTETGEKSWSLNLSYGKAMWLDLVCNGLKARLAASERWRGSVTGQGAACDPAARLANLLPELIQELRRLLDDPKEVEALARHFLNRVEPGA